jgi:hypothetical protein
MCKRHSFAVTKVGRVIDGLGLTDSHTTMLDIAGLSAKQHDTCNLYEWQPPKGWPEASWLDGLTVDRRQFVPKVSHDKAAESHLRLLYPDMAAWDAGDVIRWDALDLPDADRVHRAYDLALKAAPLAKVSDGDVIEAVDDHLRRLGLDLRVTEVMDADSVWDSVWASVRDSVRDSVRASVRASVRDSVWDSVRDSVRASVWDSVRDSVWDSVWDSVRASVWDSVWDSVWASVRASVRDSVWASVWAPVWDSVDSSMVLADDVNAFLPLAELAAKGAYLFGVTDEGVCCVWRAER